MRYLIPLVFVSGVVLAAVLLTAVMRILFPLRDPR